MGEGVFHLRRALEIPDGINLKGAGRDQTELRHQLRGPAIQIVDVERITLSDFSVHSTALDTPYRSWIDDESNYDDLPEDNRPLIEWGLITLSNASSISFYNLLVSGRRENRFLRGICARLSRDLIFSELEVSDFGRSAISLVSSCDCSVVRSRTSFSFHGIIICQNDSKKMSKNIIVKDNKCHDNKQAGILLLSSISEELSGNECWGNEFHGICLQRFDQDGAEPSQARITANKCHDNNLTGIALLSSISEELSGNECWGNELYGICLRRLDRDGAEPSQARITANKCHDNNHTGIVLFSSISEELSGNECWGNEFHGICLRRLDQDGAEPSQARITANKCHDNKQAGIVLFSSISEELSGNECWGDEFHGIYLTRSPQYRAEPSTATITGNRCHDHPDGTGFAIDIAAETTALGNVVFRNARDPTLVDPQGRYVGLLDWVLEVSDETPDATLARIHNTISWGKVATRLASNSLDESDALARFVTGHGGLGDLLKWLAEPIENSTEAESDTPHIERPRRLNENFELSFDNHRLYRFSGSDVTTPQAAIWRGAAQHVLKQTAGVTFVGLFGDHSGLSDRVAKDALSANRMDIYEAQSRRTTPTGSRALLASMNTQGFEFCAPLVIDCQPRGREALSGRPNAEPLLEPILDSRKALWRERLLYLARSPVLLTGLAAICTIPILLAVGVGWMKGFADPLSNPLGAARHAWTLNVVNQDWSDWLILPATGISFFSGAIAYLDLNLPRFLKFKRSGGGSSERGGPWRRWVRQRVFGGGQIGIVICRNVHEWSSDDVEAIDDLFALRPGAASGKDPKSLIFVIESPTRAILDRTLLRAVKQDGERAIAIENCEVFACLGAEPAKLRIEDAQGDCDLANLLGQVGSDAGDRLDQARAGIRSERFSIADIIPMLCLGSSPMAAFHLSRHAESEYAVFGPSYSALLTSYAQIYEADPDLSLDLRHDVARLNALVGEARESSAVFALTRRSDRETYIDCYGRFQAREEMLKGVAATLSHARADTVAALRGYLKCGEFHACACVRQALAASPPRLDHAKLAWRSGLWLRGEHDAIEDPVTEVDTRRTCIVDKEWGEALKLLDALSAGEASSLELASVYAISLSFRPDEPPVSDSGARQALEHEVSSTDGLFEALDGSVALRLAQKRLMSIAVQLPKARLEQLNARLRLKSHMATSLANRIAGANSVEAVLDILQTHQRAGAITLTTVLSHAARCANTIERQEALALNLARHRTDLDGLSETEKPLGYAQPDSSGFDLMAQMLDSQDFWDLMTAEGASPPESGTSSAEIMYGALSDIFSLEETTGIVEIAVE